MVLDLTGFSWVILLWGLSGSFWQMAPGTGIICRLTWAGDPEYSFISMCDVSDGMSDTGRRYPGTCLSHMSSSYGHPALSPSSLRWFKHLIWYLASDGLADKEFTCNAGDPISFPGLETSPGERKGYLLQYSGLENSMNSIVLGVGKSQTRLRPQVNKLIKGVFPEAEDKVARLLRIYQSCNVTSITYYG